MDWLPEHRDSILIDMSKDEIWKEIPGFEGAYQISSLGRINSKPRNGTKGGMLVGRLSQFGYHVVLLRLRGVRSYIFVHRLVAQAFIPNPKNYPQVNHKDENKLNNCVDNLEWCTAKYNMNYGTIQSRKSIKRIGFEYSIESRKKMSESAKRVAKRGALSPYAKKVFQFDKDLNFIKEWGSLSEVENELGYHRSNVGAVARGKKPFAYGYIWRYDIPNDKVIDKNK